MRLSWTVLLATLARSAAAGEPILEPPWELACGVEAEAPAAGRSAPGGSAEVAPGVRLLPDLPFALERGYGYVDSGPGFVAGAAFGGDPRWRPAFRQGCRKYSFRVPNGEYLIRLTFLETEVSAPGLRVFDVSAEEEKLFAAVDIALEAGDFVWLSREGLVEVRDGWLDLRFEPAAGSRPARLSRIRLEPASAIPAALEAPRGFRAEGGPNRVSLRWEAPSPGIAGYGVFQADSPDGPFESLTEHPLAVLRFSREERLAGPSFYRARAYGLRGGQSPLTPPVAARPASLPLQGLKVLDLQVPDAARAEMSPRDQRAPFVTAGLIHYGSRFPIEVAYLTDGGRWQAKKSYRIRLGSDTRRRIFGRRELLLLAEAGDPTLLREKLAAELDRVLSLPSPEVNPVHVLLNGRYQGLYFDREPLGAAFRRRAGLDPAGGLVKAPGRLRLQAGWEPYGESRGQSGDLRDLAYFVHELNRVNEGEIEAYFEERFYLDRLIDRLAAAAVRGADPALASAEPPRNLLHDSRNGKWDILPGDRNAGDFGIEDFRSVDPARAGAARARRALWGWSLQGADPGSDPRWRSLETRLFHRPALWARYLDRVQAILQQVLTPERYQELLAAARAPIAGALFPDGEGQAQPRDLLLWPEDGGASFRGAPEALAAFYREHHRLLLAAVAEEKARPPEPLVLNELALLPAPAAEGGAQAGPWLELRNVSAGPVDLSTYFLADDLDRPDAFRFPRGASVPAGGAILVVFGATAPGGPIACHLRPSPDGGELGLFHVAAGGGAVSADILHYGRQTTGLAYARLPDAAAAHPGGGVQTWGFTASPSPGGANAGEALALPPWRFRSGLEVDRAGAPTVWLQVPGPVEPLAGASVHLREEGSSRFEQAELLYQKDTYRYQLTLGPEKHGKRLAYYFSARSARGPERAYPLGGPLAPFVIPVKPPLFINEVLPRPAPAGGGAPTGGAPTGGAPTGGASTGGQPEFVEIFNAGDEKVSVDGMFLSDDRRNSTKFRISAPEPIPSKGYLVIYTDGRGEGTHANFRLSNAGEYLGLFHSAEEGNLLIDQMTFPAIPVNHSYGRERDGVRGFKVWKDPTPGARNMPRIPPELLKKKDGDR